LGRNITSSPFSGKTTLTSLTIGNSVTSIGSSAVSGCTGLTGTLTIPNSVTSIGSSAFQYCTGLTELTIPNSVTSIGSSAFSDCTGLTGTLTIPNSVTSIGGYAFSGCTGLTGTLTIPNSVTSIGSSAFSGCSGLTGTLTIGNSVTSIGDYAFSGCFNLMEINSKNQTPPQAQSNTFEGVDKQACTLYVPVGCTTIYWLHPVWEDFFNIQEKNFPQAQTIDFPEISIQIYGNPAIVLNQYSSAGLEITYTSNNEEVAVVSGNTLILLNAGTAQITATQVGNANYEAALPIIRSLAVKKALLTITAENKSRKQGEDNPLFTLLYSEFKNNENESVLDELPAISCDADKNSPVGFYDIVLSGGSDNNYEFSLENGKLEITAANSINEISVQNIFVYPNPANQYVYISSDSLIKKIELYDSVSNLILTETNVTDKIDVSVLNAGWYIVRIYTENKTISHKIIVRH
jgi:hypothetical protein